MTVATEIQSLSPSALIELFQLDLSSLGDNVYFFHAGTNGLRQEVFFAGNSYVAFPIEATGFERNARDKPARPKITASNVTGVMSALVMFYDDIVGAQLIRIRTFARFLDAINFPSGNPNADPGEYVSDVWFVERKLNEDKQVVSWELASALDLSGVYLPRRQTIQNLCSWQYRGEGCGYAGGAVANEFDQATADFAQDKCGKRLSSCKLRFGQFAALPFGGFPAAGLMKG